MIHHSETDGPFSTWMSIRLSAGGVLDPVPDRVLLPVAIEAAGDLVVEDERVPREAAARAAARRRRARRRAGGRPRWGGGGASERGSRRAPRARRAGGRACRVSQLQLDAGLLRTLAGDREHRRRGVDAEHLLPGPPRQRGSRPCPSRPRARRPARPPPPRARRRSRRPRSCRPTRRRRSARTRRSELTSPSYKLQLGLSRVLSDDVMVVVRTSPFMPPRLGAGAAARA